MHIQKEVIYIISYFTCRFIDLINLHSRTLTEKQYCKTQKHCFQENFLNQMQHLYITLRYSSNKLDHLVSTP